MSGDKQQARREAPTVEGSFRRPRGGRQEAEFGPGLAGRDAPGKRSGHGIGSVMDQMQKDQQRNANQSDPGAELPTPARAPRHDGV